jgi:hypothetical protein
MRYNYLTHALCSAVLLLNGVTAEEVAADSASSAIIEKPTFTVCQRGSLSAMING